MDRKIYCFDIDGVICTNTHGRYEDAQPIQLTIDAINALYEQGHIIKLWTARGQTTGLNWYALTKDQLRRWEVHYHSIAFNKLDADYYIDDKAINIEDWNYEDHT